MERPAVRFAPVVVLLTIVCGAAPASAQAPSAVVSIPDVTGPIPITATSYPLMTSSKLQTIVDLPKAGYLEEEFFVTGRANVYDWSADGQVAVKTPNAPYTTRIMLRRPSDARRFSGNVIVEIVNSARRYDFPFAWGVSHDYFMENGDAFVLITLAQTNLQAELLLTTLGLIGAFLAVCVGGVLFAWLRLSTGHLAGSMVAHSAFNALLLLGLGSLSA